MSLPDATRRLFPHTELPDLDASNNRPFVIERLLEEGETADLRWLAAQVEEGELADWLASRGGRRLSRRSRAFWELLLGVAAAKPAAGADALWTL